MSTGRPFRALRGDIVTTEDRKYFGYPLVSCIEIIGQRTNADPSLNELIKKHEQFRHWRQMIELDNNQLIISPQSLYSSQTGR